MQKISGKMGGFTPVFDAIVKDLGPVAAHVFGRIWRYCQMERHVCDASKARIARECGLSERTVIRWANALCQAGYLEDTTPALRNKPHTYRDTGRVTIEAHIVAVSTDTPTLTESQTNDTGHDTESDLGLPESHSRHDRESQEETSKRPMEETKNIPAPIVAESTSHIPHPCTLVQDKVPTSHISHLQQRFGKDPLDLIARCAEAQARAEVSDFTTPPAAGGGDSLADDLFAAWCSAKRLNSDAVPDSLSAKWRLWLSNLAATVPVTAAQAIQALRTVLDPDDSRFSFYNYNSPANEKFKRDWTDVALQLLSGTAQEQPARQSKRRANREADWPTDAEQTAIWITHGDQAVEYFEAVRQAGLTAFGTDRYLNPDSHSPHLASRLGLTARQASALACAYTRHIAAQRTPIDPVTFFEEA